MDFNLFGIGKNNRTVKISDNNETRFGIRKGDKIGPLNKDTISFSGTNLKQELEQEIQRLAENCRGSKEIFSETLLKIAKRGTEENTELLAQRIKTLKSCDENDTDLLFKLIHLEFSKNPNASFLLDKLEEIKKIFKEKEISTRSFYTNQGELIKVLTPENYSTFLEYAKNNKLKGDDFSSLVMYKIKPHKIEFGNESVKVDSSEIISLISGHQSISTVRENSYKKFEETVNSLIAKDYEKNEEQYYYKITEGILSQMPELAEIAVNYQNYAESFRNRGLTKEDYANAMENYFVNLARSGIMPEKIELKTIVPDENALISPELTLRLFLNGETVSQQKK